MCRSGLPVCLYVQCLQKTERGQSSWDWSYRLANGCGLPRGCWEPNLVRSQPVLLPLQPHPTPTLKKKKVMFMFLC